MYVLAVCDACYIEQPIDYPDISLIFICKPCREKSGWSIPDIQRWTEWESRFIYTPTHPKPYFNDTRPSH